MTNRNANSTQAIQRLLKQRIVILDGAMGTMVQALELDEAAFRGAQFRGHPQDVHGNIDLLNLTQPEVIRGIHRQYLEAGADILETNTFNSNGISMAEYRLQEQVYELNFAGAQNARRAIEEFEAAQPERMCFVAGAMGPTNRTASMSQNVNSPGSRGVTFDALRDAYYEQARALLEGGADLLLLDTNFDTLNAKAALFAMEQYFQDAARRVPVMLSVTIADQSGRTLSGQTVEAFWISISHADLLSVGINCALGAKQIRPYLQELAKLAPVYVSCHPNAGLPNAFGAFDETPEIMARDMGSFAAQGWLNIAGGCCGTTPAHIRAIAEAVREFPPREVPEISGQELAVRRWRARLKNG